MTFNQFQNVDGEIQKDGMTISYTICWVRDVPRDTVQIDTIEKVTVLDSENEEIVGYYDDHTNEINDLILEDAYKHEPDEWETPSYEEILEARAEEQYEAMQIEKHFA